MLQYRECFKTFRLTDSLVQNIRVVGVTLDKKFLILSNSATESSIEKVSPEGDSVTVISFNKKIDIINASLSHDNEICHITEKIDNGKTIKFVSSFYSIFQSAKSNEITADVPIEGFFLPITNSKNIYQMIHIIGKRLTHLKITLKKKHIDVEKIRGGLHLQNLISFDYNHEKENLTVIYSNDDSQYLSIFGFKSQTIEELLKYKIFIMETSVLPYDVALCPASRQSLPYYHLTPNRIYVYTNNKKSVIIQQLNSNTYQHLSFCVSSYPDAFNQVIQVPSVSADMPICFANFNSIIIVYITNTYFCIIDADLRPAHITVLPKILATSICYYVSVSLPIENTLIDINSRQIYSVAIDFSCLFPYYKIIDDCIIYAFALFINSNLDSKYLSDILELLRLTGEIHHTQIFFQTLFQKLAMPTQGIKSQKSRSHTTLAQYYKNMQQKGERLPPSSAKIGFPAYIRETLESIEADFPSSGPISRRSAFRLAVKALHEKKVWRESEKNAKKAIKFLEKQNRATVMIREALDIFEKRYKPPNEWLINVEIIIATEASFISFPTIPCLSSDIATLGLEMFSKPLRQKFESAKIMTPFEQSKEEVYFWKDRMNIAGSSGLTTSTSSSTASGHADD